jgi:hypothetical protein
MREVLEPFYDLESVAIKDVFKNRKKEKHVTVWLNTGEIPGEILEQFSIPVDADEETIKKFAYACIDIETLKDKLS